MKGKGWMEKEKKPEKKPEEKQKTEKKKKGSGVIWWIILVLLFTAAGYFIRITLPALNHKTVIETDILKSELIRISELATYQKEYRETVVKEKDGFFSQRYFATFDGVIKAGIDLENANIEKREEEEMTVIEVTLPEAEILTHTDDNWKVVYEDGYQKKEIGEERNSVIKKKKKKVEEKFIEEGGLAKAEEKAKSVIEDFIKTAYGDEVTVVFSGEEADS